MMLHPHIIKSLRIGMTALNDFERQWAEAAGVTIIDLTVETQCTGKQAYHSYRHAAAVIRSRQRKAKKTPNKSASRYATLKPYRCEHCDAHHIAGSTRPRKIIKKRKAK